MKLTIIASGNSLRNFDFSQIKGDIMAINCAYKHIPRYDMIASFDKTAAIRNQCKKLHTLLEYQKDLTENCVYWNKSGEIRLIDRKTVGNFNASVCFGLNIAINLGYDEIYILGCDNHTTDFVHFYDKKPDRKLAERYNKELFPLVNKYMNLIANDTRFHQIETKIFMVDSKIECFENLTMEEYLK